MYELGYRVDGVIYDNFTTFTTLDYEQICKKLEENGWRKKITSGIICNWIYQKGNKEIILKKLNFSFEDLIAK